MSRATVSDVVIVTDKAFLPYAATTLASVVAQSHARPLRIHVLHEGDLTAEDARRLRVVGGEPELDLRLHAIRTSWLPRLPSKGPSLGNRVSWLRLAIPETLADVERALYVDADVLVTDDLNTLLDVDIEGYYGAAVANVIEPTMRWHVAEIGLDPSDYFNAGVLLLNLAAMRNDRVIERALDFVFSDPDRARWFDQDALNVAFGGNWLRLAPRWNTQNSFWYWPSLAESTLGKPEVDAARLDPGIVHFEGPAIFKPWHYLCASPFTAAYRQHMGSTPWGSTSEVVGRTPLNILLARLPFQSRHRVYYGLEDAQDRVRRLISRIRRRLLGSRAAEARGSRARVR